MVIPEAHIDVYSGDYYNQMRDACQRNQSKSISKKFSIRNFLNPAELMLKWNLSKTCLCGIPKDEFRTLQHGPKSQRRHILEKMLIAFVTGFEVVIGNTLIEMMDVMETNVCSKPLKQRWKN